MKKKAEDSRINCRTPAADAYFFIHPLSLILHPSALGALVINAKHSRQALSIELTFVISAAAAAGDTSAVTAKRPVATTIKTSVVTAAAVKTVFFSHHRVASART